MTMVGSLHPALHRDRVSLAALSIGLCGAPAIWSIQLVLNYALASYSCYPGAAPRSTVLPNWRGVWVALLIINLVGIALALGATLLSYRNWHLTRGEHPGAPDEVIEAGEGRTRFIGLAGALAGAGFTLAVIFGTIAILGVPQCNG